LGVTVHGPRCTGRAELLVAIALVVLGACGGGSDTATSSTPVPGMTASASSQVTVASASASAPVTASAPSLPDGIQAEVPVGQGPITLAATDDAIWVELHRANIVSKVDPDSGDVVGELRVPEACGLAVDDHDLWVTTTTGLVRVDPDTLAEQATVELGELVFGIAIGPDAVWAQGESGGGTVWRIDPSTNAVTTEIAAPGASAIAMGSDSVWVAARDDAVVYRIDPATNSVAATIELPGPIGGVGVGLDGVWVSGFGDGWVSRIDPETDEVTGSISTGYVHLGPPITAFGSVWVAALDEDVVLRIDPAKLASST